MTGQALIFRYFQTTLLLLYINLKRIRSIFLSVILRRKWIKLIFEQIDKNPRSDTDHKDTNLVDLSTYYNDVFSDSNMLLITTIRLKTLDVLFFISYSNYWRRGIPDTAVPVYFWKKKQMKCIYVQENDLLIHFACFCSYRNFGVSHNFISFVYVNTSFLDTIYNRHGLIR